MNLIPGLAVITDQNGNYLAGTAGQVPATVNAAGQSTSTYAMQVTGGIGPTGLVTPFSVDATGAAVIRNGQAVTQTFAPSAQINTTASSGKSMLSVYNPSGSGLYQRILGFFAMCPPQAGTTQGLLGSSSTYTTVGFGAFRFTGGHTGGTVVAGALHDTRDSADANFVCRTGATISGQSSAALCVMDAAYSSTFGYGSRADEGVKVWTFAPGEGITFNCLSSVGGSGVNFYLRLITAQNTA